MKNVIELPPDLQAQVEQKAFDRGLSVNEFVREALQWAMIQDLSPDPLFTDHTAYQGEAPENLAAEHDLYLYGNNA